MPSASSQVSNKSKKKRLRKAKKRSSPKLPLALPQELKSVSALLVYNAPSADQKVIADSEVSTQQTFTSISPLSSSHDASATSGKKVRFLDTSLPLLPSVSCDGGATEQRLKFKKRLSLTSPEGEVVRRMARKVLQEDDLVSPRSILKKKRQKGTFANSSAHSGEQNGSPTKKRRFFESWKVISEKYCGDTIDVKNSTQVGKDLFRWLIYPITPENFFQDAWEQKPLLVKRRCLTYYDGLFTTTQFEHMLRENDIQYSVNLDITKYENGQRETLNPIGRAYAPVVWDFYQSGCSIRLLNPQTFSKEVWRLNSFLQGIFGTFVGANVYLTPAGTQGFAPHWDDIEAFVLQLEGRKHWKVYAPRNEEESLPTTSSRNFTQSEIGMPVLDAVLEAGDLLYMPRGFIHQACAQSDIHSLHITVSTTQNNTWGHLLQKLLPQAVATAMREDIDFRKSLPPDFMDFVGLVHSDRPSEHREQFVKVVRCLLGRLLDYANIDGAADQMAKQYLHEALPPCLTARERNSCIHACGEHWKDGHVIGSSELNLKTRVKLIRKDCMRLVMEGDSQTVVYHSVENSRVYKEKEPQSFEILADLAAGVEYLITCYPDFVSVGSIPLANDEDKVELATIFYDKGLLTAQITATVDNKGV